MPAGSLTVLCGVLVQSCASRFVSHTAVRQLLLLGCSYLFCSTWAGLPFLLLLIASSLMSAERRAAHHCTLELRRSGRVEAPDARSIWMCLAYVRLESASAKGSGWNPIFSPRNPPSRISTTVRTSTVTE